MDLVKKHSLISKYTGIRKVCLNHKARMAFSIQVCFQTKLAKASVKLEPAGCKIGNWFPGAFCKLFITLLNHGSLTSQQTQDQCRLRCMSSQPSISWASLETWMSQQIRHCIKLCFHIIPYMVIPQITSTEPLNIVRCFCFIMHFTGQ